MTSGAWRSTPFAANPIGGLGQDNFGNYYVPRAAFDRGAGVDA